MPWYVSLGRKRSSPYLNKIQALELNLLYNSYKIVY